MDQDTKAQEQYDHLSDEVTDFILKKMEEVQTSKRFKNIDETDFMHSIKFIFIEKESLVTAILEIDHFFQLFSKV